MRIEYVSLGPFLQWWTLVPDPDWSVPFGRQAPLDLEIGFGNGEFLAREAAAHPERNFLGVERRWSGTGRALRRLEHAGVENVRLLQMDARVMLRRLIHPRSLGRVFCFFPCPWRKEKDAKHRIHSREFWRLLGSRMEPGGSSTLVTDWQDYADWVERQLVGAGWRVERSLVPAHLGTRYERKWAAKGQQEFHRFQMTVVEQDDVPLEETPTLHVHRVNHFDPERFVAPEVLGAELTIRCKELVHDPVREVALLRTVIVEEHLMQHIWIRIARRGDLWKIFPSTGTGYIPTRGVQETLARVKEACVVAGAHDLGPEGAPVDAERDP